MLLPNDRCLVAVSGGPDSLALLLLLSKWAKREGWKLKVAYFHHQIRNSADEEIAFMREWAERLCLPFVSGTAPCPEMQKKEKLSLEEIARRERYRFLKKEASCFGSEKVAVGHHLDDQMETFFVNLIRGSGLSGLAGMKPKNGMPRSSRGMTIIRPLLCVTKQEILAYLAMQNMSYCKDETNDSPSMLRNRVRHRLLPFLKKEFEWNLGKSLPRMMKVFSAEHQLLSAIEKEWGRHGIHWEKEGGASVGIQNFIHLDEALQRRIIKKILDRFCLNRNYSGQHIEENRRLFFNPVSHKRVVLPEGVVARRLKNEIRWDKDCRK